MRTTWTDWKPKDMRDAAESEARTGFDALGAMERDFVTALPYYGAFTEYRDHVTGCRNCREDGRADCPEGTGLLDVASVGLRTQARLALDN